MAPGSPTGSAFPGAVPTSKRAEVITGPDASQPLVVWTGDREQTPDRLGAALEVDTELRLPWRVLALIVDDDDSVYRGLPRIVDDGHQYVSYEMSGLSD